jgi:hypothetical protein
MTTPLLTQRFAIQSNNLSSDAIDNEVVIVNLRNGLYYSLTELGAEIWNYVQAQWSLGEMIERIEERYASDRACVREWIVRFLSELEDEALIVRMAASQTATAAAMAGGAMMFHVPVPLKRPSLMKFTDMTDVTPLTLAPNDYL